MKRLIGMFLAVAGGATAIWGVSSVLTGSASARVWLTDDLSVTALMVGLVGVTAFTAGLIWVRD